MSVFYALLEFLLTKEVELRVAATELTGVSRTTLCARFVLPVLRVPIGLCPSAMS